MHYDDDYLAHYGVLGMKWGVRKDGLPRGTQGSGPKAKKGRKKNPVVLSADKKEANSYLKRDPSSLSNLELKNLNKRMELETNYRRLTGKDKSSFQKVHNQIKAGLAVFGTLTALHKTLNSDIGKKATNKGKQYINRNLLQIASVPYNK